MGKYGYAVDSALSARVALASGEVVTASLDENPNLFWALRGAGYNFGVVTSLKLRVEACPHRIFFALLAYQTSEFEALIAASAEYAKTQGGEDSLGIIYGTQDAFGGPGESMLLILYYHGHDEAEARRRFKPVMDIPHMPLRCGMEWLTAACDLVESTIPYTRRYADSTAMADMSFDALKPALRKCAPGWQSMAPGGAESSSTSVFTTGGRPMPDTETRATNVLFLRALPAARGCKVVARLRYLHWVRSPTGAIWC